MKDYIFNAITSKYSANAIQFRTHTIFKIVNYHPQLYTNCFVPVYIHTKFNNLESIGRYLFYDRNQREQGGSCSIAWG
jgi:hypothetical protein